METNPPTRAVPVSNAVFPLGPLPILTKAVRTKNLASYSLGNILMSNVGNILYAIYVIHLPLGPIWFLHAYNSLSTGLMLVWYLKYEGLPLEWRSFSDHATTRLLLNLCCSPTS